MKVVAKEIEMIAWFKKLEIPIPIKLNKGFAIKRNKPKANNRTVNNATIFLWLGLKYR